MSRRQRLPRAHPAKLPGNDPRWMPLADVHRLFCQRTGSPYLAATDLTAALRAGMRSMVRYMPRERIHQPELPERELLSADYWDQHEIQHWSDGLLVAVKQLSHQVLRVWGYFFVWEPDVKDFFSDKIPAPKSDPAPKSGSVSKAGPAAAWIDELFSAAELRLMTGKQVFEAIDKEARDRGLKKWPGLRAVQNELAARKTQK